MTPDSPDIFNKYIPIIKDGLKKIGKSLIADSVPFGGTFVSIMETAKAFREVHTNDRITQFYHEFSKGETISDDTIDSSFSLDDYYTILNSCINDEESSKISIYAEFYKSLLSQKVDQNLKVQLIKSLRSLGKTDIDFLKEMYISSYDAIKNIHKKQEGLYFFIDAPFNTDKKNLSSEQSAYAQRLASFGLIDSSKEHLPLTKAGINLIESSFDKNKITPEWINSHPKRNLYAVILWTGKNYDDYYTICEKIAMSLKYKVHAYSFKHFTESKSFSIKLHRDYCDALIIILSKSADKEDYDLYAKNMSAKLLPRSIFIEPEKSQSKTSGVWKLNPDRQDMIFYISKKESDDSLKLTELLNRIKQEYEIL